MSESIPTETTPPAVDSNRRWRLRVTLSPVQNVVRRLQRRLSRMEVVFQGLSDPLLPDR